MLSTLRSARLVALRRPSQSRVTVDQAWKSTYAASDRLKASKCPQQSSLAINDGHSRAWQSTASVDQGMNHDDEESPKLVEIPALPLVGSMISSFSKTPPMDNPYKAWPELRRRFGDFFSLGMPGVGSDMKGTTYIIQDPKEMMKILRREGIYPTSIVQKQWAMARFLEENDFGRVAGILGHGA